MIQFQKDKLAVQIYPTCNEMGAAAGKEIAACIHRLLYEKPEINMIFAAAPSQNEVLAALAADPTIPWERIHAFHMDEYVGIAPEAPQGFAQFLKRAIFDKLPFASVNLIDCTAEPQAEAARYSALLQEHPADIVCMGIGENGHIAFNDPHVAKFDDPHWVKVVDLDETCRMQQVHDGCFASLDEVPKYALTLTVPTLARAPYRFCVVPAATKANAVKNTVEGPIGEACPATVLRQTEGSVLYCDADSAALLKTPFEVGFITDEVSQDLKVAAEFALKYGLTALEIRSVDGLSPFEYTDEKIAEIKAICREKGLHIVAVSSPLFKCDFDDADAVQNHIQSFKRLAAQAKELGAKLIRGFDFWACGASLEARAEKFQPIIEICRKYGITLVVEYDPKVHSCTAQKLAELVAAINDPCIKALYDPGNGPHADPTDIPYPDAYEALKPKIAHIHAKDSAIRKDKACCLKIGEGTVDYAGLLKQLFTDGYTGGLMLETHYRKKTELTDEQLKQPGGQAFSDGAYEASTESMEQLLNLIKEARKEALK